MSQGTIRDQVFISYNHKDEEWLQNFVTMLAPVENAGSLEIWNDRKIRPGEDWSKAIHAAISRAKVALLLVSDNFLASDFIMKSELPEILQRNVEDGLQIYWVYLTPSLVEMTPLGKLQAAHSTKKSLFEMKEPSEIKSAIATICREIASELGQFSNLDKGVRSTFKGKVQGVLSAKYEITAEIAAGEYSIVYRGQQTSDGLDIAVKAIATSPLQAWDIDNFGGKINKSRNLRNPAYIKTFEVNLKDEPYTIVMERVTAPTLTDVLRRSGPLGTRRVARVLMQIAEALSEAHREALIYGSLRPSSIFMVNDDLVKFPAVDLSNQVTMSERMRGGVATSYDMLTYMIPEIYDGGLMSIKSDQYYLGLLALEMLNGEPPVKITCVADFERKKRFFENPRPFLEAWRSTAPGLAIIVGRMLSRDPEQRWPTMDSVSRMLHSSGEYQSLEDPVEVLTKRSYKRRCEGNPNFYRKFYKRFFERSPESEMLFARVSMRRQYRMLDQAVAMLCNFRPGSEPTSLSQVAYSHRKLGLHEKQYQDFGEAFIDVLRENKEDEDTLNAWRFIFARGISYIVKHSPNE